MSNRYTRSEKGKWVAGASRSSSHRSASQTQQIQQTRSQRTPVRIPQSNNSELIEDNKLTLLGRVTNPAKQKPQWVLDWLIQFWNLETAVTGRTLGPDLFQAKFETEEALLSVMRRAPFHYKRWMVILQRWEPVISASFPRRTPFWINIHGLPLHFWTFESLEAIAKALGPRLDEDVPQGRLRIDVDCLRNLEMHLPVELPSGDVLTVDLEYENLQKHCFFCFSLFHEVDDCPTKPTSAKVSTQDLGISQHNTLRNLEEHRRRQDQHRVSSSLSRNSDGHSRGDQAVSQRSTTSRLAYSDRRHYNEASRYQYSHDARQSGRANENYQRQQQRYPSDRRERRDRSPTHATGNRRTSSDRTQYSQSSRTPPPMPEREERILPVIPERTENSGRSLERRSALERIEPPQQEQRSGGLSSSLLARLQDVEVNYEPEDLRNKLNEVSSGSKNAYPSPGEAQGSDQRRRASLRIGTPAGPSSAKAPKASAVKRKATPKTAAKKKAAAPSAAKGKKTTRAKVNRSPLQSTRLSKQMTSRSTNPPRKKLCVERMLDENIPGAQAQDPPTLVHVPATRKRADFRGPRNPIP